MAEKIKLVKMARTSEAAGDGPLTAEVHPDEIANYTLGGFVVAEPAEEEPVKRTAAEAISAAAACVTIEDLEKLAAGEERKTVLDAIDKRRKELQPAALRAGEEAK